MSYRFDNGEVHEDLSRPLPELHEAARRGDLDVLRRAIGANPLGVNMEDWAGLVPLFHAVDSGVLEAVRLLLDGGADPSGAGTMMSPIVNAARRNNLAMLRLLVERGTDPDHADDADGSTPLHYAAYHGNREMVEYLLGLGVRLNVQECDGFYPLTHALDCGHVAVAERLRIAGAVSGREAQ